MASSLGLDDWSPIASRYRIAAAAALSLAFLWGCSPSNSRSADAWGLGDDAGPDAMDTTERNDGTDTPPDTEAPDPCDDAPVARISAKSGADQVIAASQGTLEAEPVPELSLDAEGSTVPNGGEIARVKWRVLEQPGRSIATFRPGKIGRDDEVEVRKGTAERAPTLGLGLTGSYKIGLEVWDTSGQASCNTATLTVEVLPDAEFYVEFRYPFHEDEEEQNAVEQCCPWLDFHFKRTASADWYDSAQVIPKRFAGKKNDHDWGEKGVEADDPQLGNVLDTGGTNRYVSIDRIEASTTFVGSVEITGPTDHLPMTTTTRIFIDGQLRKTIDYEITERDAQTALELFRFQKVDGSYDIRETLTEIENYPQP